MMSSPRFDVTDPASVVRGVAAVEEAVGGLDILVNNTGAQHRAAAKGALTMLAVL